MGEAAESKKSRGGCSTLRNWMGEPTDDQDEKTLELSLGLPGGGAAAPPGWRTASKEKDTKHSAVHSSMLSLGYSAAPFSPHSQGMDAIISSHS